MKDNIIKLPIENMLTQIKDEVIKQMYEKKRVASGKTIENIEIVMLNENHGQILVPSYFQYIEKGSGPGKRGSWFYDTIYKWVKDKGIESDNKKARKIGGAIAHNIIEKGTKAYIDGGQNVFSNEVNNIIDENIITFNINNFISL